MGIFRRIRKNKYVCMVLLLLGCENENLDYSFVPEGFVTDVKLRFTPVKNQGRSELCWIYSVYGAIESEYLMRGDSIDLSTDYAGRMFLEEQAREYFLSGGKKSISLRGVGPMTLELGRRYGIVEQKNYSASSSVDFFGLVNSVKEMADSFHASGDGNVDSFMASVTELLDNHIGVIPTEIDSMKISVGDFDSYITLMCNKKKSYGEMHDPELKDNRYGCKAKNVSQDTLVARVTTSLKMGHAVMWEGGPNDNHALVLVGMGHDSKGKNYFVGKNSWGTNNPTCGFVFIPEKYLKKHTALVVMKDNR